jgi:penicillin-binding protein 2
MREPEQGSHVVLFIERGLQKRIIDELTTAMAARGVTKGAAVALDPRSGAVRALVSLPGYDNNLFSSGISADEYRALVEAEDQPLFNRAIAGLYPPGSTVKPFLAVAGLEQGVIDESTTVLANGSITVAGQTFGDWRVHGLVNLTKALAVSSNIFFYALGGGYGDLEGLGPFRIKEYLSRFRLDERTGIDLPGERQGFIPDPEWKKEIKNESWYIGDTYNTSIGQGFVSVSPLELAVSTAAIANGGTILRPRLVKGTAQGDINTLALTEPEIVASSIASTTALAAARKGMRESVLSGYTRTLQQVPVPVAAKTGTAENIPGMEPHAWVAAFAPYENPEILLVLLVENGGLGSDTVVPVAQKVLSWYFGERTENE